MYEASIFHLAYQNYIYTRISTSLLTLFRYTLGKLKIRVGRPSERKISTYRCLVSFDPILLVTIGILGRRMSRIPETIGHRATHPTVRNAERLGHRAPLATSNRSNVGNSRYTETHFVTVRSMRPVRTCRRIFQPPRVSSYLKLLSVSKCRARSTIPLALRNFHVPRTLKLCPSPPPS